MLLTNAQVEKQLEGKEDIVEARAIAMMGWFGLHSQAIASAIDELAEERRRRKIAEEAVKASTNYNEIVSQDYLNFAEARLLSRGEL